MPTRFHPCLRRKTRSARRKEARRGFGGRSSARPKRPSQAFVRCFPGAKAPPKTPPIKTTPSLRTPLAPCFAPRARFQNESPCLIGIRDNFFKVRRPTGRRLGARAARPRGAEEWRGWKPHLRKLRDGCGKLQRHFRGAASWRALAHGERGGTATPRTTRDNCPNGTGRTIPGGGGRIMGLRQGDGKRASGSVGTPPVFPSTFPPTEELSALPPPAIPWALGRDGWGCPRSGRIRHNRRRRLSRSRGPCFPHLPPGRMTRRIRSHQSSTA